MGFEGRLGHQVATFLELLDAVRAGRGPDGAPSGSALSLADTVFVGHWARRLLPEDGGTHCARRSHTPRAAAHAEGPVAPAAPADSAFALAWERAQQAQQAQRGREDARVARDTGGQG